ncbi:hypothetical protein ACHHYP_13572 [Achlya hypogyna]|uniref:BED-type domain-containing protein n=1 Tax=Achlya hypogyna TaxID=1202772 RepID=A0A1V9YF29_ACHHY|nr:hypothetical protein ACHHYP_13572 [Achlya hypogyna]
MGRACSLTEWAHFVKTAHKANLSYWWVYCRHCVIAAIAAAEPDRQIAAINTPEALHAFVGQLPPPDAESTAGPRALVGRRSVMKAHLAQCVHASAIPPNPIVKRRAGKRGVHCAIAEWAHFDRLEKEGYIGNSNYFPVRCKYCVKAHAAGTRPTPPEVLAGRKETMRSHLSRCAYFTGKLPAKRQKDSKLALDEWQFFIQLDRQPGTYYHFAKCKFCHDAYERGRAAGQEVAPPKVILGRKHNMQTHLANCEHILNHDAVLDDIVMSSDEDADEAADSVDAAPLAAPTSGTPRLHALAQASSASGSASASPLARLMHLSMGHGSPAAAYPRAATPEGRDLEAHEALLAFTLENGLPFMWLDAPAMQALGSLPSAAEFAGPILRRLQQQHARQLHARRREMHQAAGYTLVVQLLEVTNGAATCVAWLAHPTGVVFPSAVDGSLTWTCAVGAVWQAVERHLRLCERHVVAVALPPIADCFGQLPLQHPSLLFLPTTPAATLQGLYHVLLHDAAVFRALHAARRDSSPPIRRQEAGPWLVHVLGRRFVDSEARVILDAVTPLFQLLTTSHRVLSIAQAVHVLGQASQCTRRLPPVLDGLQQALDAHLEQGWAVLEQPVFVLAYALHPYYRDHALNKARTSFKWSTVCDVACYYYERWFQTRPSTLRGDVMAYAHVTQHMYAPSVVAEFPSASDYVLYLGDHVPELARLMAHLLAMVGSFEFEADADRLGDDHEAAQNIQYLLYCLPQLRVKRATDLEPEVRLVQWRARSVSTTTARYATEDGRNTTKITLRELFDG